MERNAQRNQANLVDSWRDLLVQETHEIELAGVNAAVVSVRLIAADGSLLTQAASRAEHLLNTLLRPTDRIGHPEPNSFVVLLSPTNELTETVERVRLYGKSLSQHKIQALTAFAHRRTGEALVNTWARAEAELDRAHYRSLHEDGLCL